MYPSEILTICLASKDWRKFNKDPNLKEAIFAHKCIFPCKNSIQVAPAYIVLDVDKSANTVKERATYLESCIHAVYVEAVERWSEKLRWRIKLNKLRWNANNVMEVATLGRKNVRYVMVRRLFLSRGICTSRWRKEWEKGIKYYSKGNQSKVLSFTLVMCTWL